MSGAGTLVGFALVFVLTAWTVSALIYLTFGATGRRLRRLGPLAERRITALAATLPVLLGTTVVATLVIRSIAGHDHCPAHDHHAHLCVAHGDAWIEQPWAVALVAAAAAVVLARLTLLGGALLRGRRAVAQLRGASRQLAEFRLVDSDRPFCFVAGLRRPEIYVSTAAWHGLEAEEREAMIAHERGHVKHHDLAWRSLLEVVVAFGAPLTSAPLFARWEHATERLRDDDAAAALGAPEDVAGAMVRLCRLGASPAGAGSVGFSPMPGALHDRVEALLAGQPRGERAAAVLARGWLVLVTAVAIAIATHAEPLHHALESLLG